MPESQQSESAEPPEAVQQPGEGRREEGRGGCSGGGEGGDSDTDRERQRHRGQRSFA